MANISSAAMALRDSFGDRKVPDITRKITSCVACRRQKIKCHMDGLAPPCNRCKARGLSCTVNKSLQMILENDAGWKEGMEERLRKIEETLSLGTNQEEGITSSTPGPQTPMASNTFTNQLNMNPANSDQRSHNSSDVALNLSCNLGSFPGSSIVTLTNEHRTQFGSLPNSQPDLISRGLISLEKAEEYFSIYRTSMEPCIYQILAEDDCLGNIRARSSMLTAAICTVGSFCTSPAVHQTCYDAFIGEVSTKLFSRLYNLDDVCALCVGAFWLKKMSSTLIGLAVRVANDLNLHRCITKMPHTKTECYERTRVYFLVYICDHQCSLIYGNPPMTREFQSLKSPKAFLESKFCNPSDVLLVSHLELWFTSSRVYDIFGADTESFIVENRETQLESLSRSFDACRSDLLNGMAVDSGPARFSRRLFDLYIHCAKLYLFSHSFRGFSGENTRPSGNFRGIEKFERCALESALAIVRSVAYGGEIQKHLEWLPSYFDAMIAFASISLMKAQSKEPIRHYLDKNEVLSALSSLVEVFEACSARIQPEHPLSSVAKSLKIAMKDFHRLNDKSLDVEPVPGGMEDWMFTFDASLDSDFFGNNSSLSCSDNLHSGFFDLQNF